MFIIRYEDGDEEDRVPAAFVRKADAPAAEEPIDEPAAEEPAAAAAGDDDGDDGDDFLAGIEDELGLNKKADEEPPVESASPRSPRIRRPTTT